MPYLLDMNTTTAAPKMTILYTDEIPEVGHNQFDKPRRFPILIQDGLWTTWVLRGRKGSRQTYGQFECVQRDTLHDLEVVLHGDHGTIISKVDQFDHLLVIDTDDQAAFLKFRYPEHHALCEFYM